MAVRLQVSCSFRVRNNARIQEFAKGTAVLHQWIEQSKEKLAEAEQTKATLETKVANEYYRYMIPDTFSWDLYSLTYDILQIHQARQSIRNNTPALDALNLGIEALINGTKNDDIILNNGILSYANTADNYIPF